MSATDPEREWEDEDEEEADRAWQELGMREFFRGYDESDSIYDDVDSEANGKAADKGEQGNVEPS